MSRHNKKQLTKTAVILKFILEIYIHKFFTDKIYQVIKDYFVYL